MLSTLSRQRGREASAWSFSEKKSTAEHQRVVAGVGGRCTPSPESSAVE
jgi:hypothetical protein